MPPSGRDRPSASARCRRSAHRWCSCRGRICCSLRSALAMAKLGLGAVERRLGAVARGGRGLQRLRRRLPRLESSTARSSAFSFSLSVILAFSTLASAAFADASARSICASSLEVSSAASTSPFFTCWFSATETERTTPESSLEISTCVSGCSVPVADTSTVRSALPAATVVYSTLASAAPSH